MLILVSGQTADFRRLVETNSCNLGCLLAPGNGNSMASVLKTGLPWAADNAAFSGFDAEKFTRLLNRISGEPRCLFAVCPDVVADAKATLKLWPWWAVLLRSKGLPAAFVLQDGQEDEEMPDADAYFIGGSTEWKLSAAACQLGAEAKRRRKWLHMGRVNSLQRLRLAYRMGCDSVDGSGYSRFAQAATKNGRTDMLLERHLRFVRGLEKTEAEQLTLF